MRLLGTLTSLAFATFGLGAVYDMVVHTLSYKT
jgi:hypothetical protein